MKKMKIRNEVSFVYFLVFVEGLVIDCGLELSWLYRGSLCLEHRLAHFTHTLAYAANKQCVYHACIMLSVHMELLQLYDSQINETNYFLYV